MCTQLLLGYLGKYSVYLGQGYTLWTLDFERVLFLRVLKLDTLLDHACKQIKVQHAVALKEGEKNKSPCCKHLVLLCFSNVKCLCIHKVD